jgi:GTP-binding protein
VIVFSFLPKLQGNKAIVVDEPGVTRDRLYGRSYWGDHEFMVVDTGGVITVSKSQSTVMEELDISTTIGMDGISLASREAAVARMPSMIEKQAIAAVEESPVIIFLVDGQVIFCLHIKSHVFPSLPCLYLLSLDSYFNIMNI